MARLTSRVSITGLSKSITIIGGGLTGLSLAIALRKNDAPVILHEAGNYPRHRVCGEFISGTSQETLETLGISGAFTDALQHTDLAWFAGNKLLRKARLPSPALGISRHLLDDKLQQLARDLGATIHTNSRKTPEPGTPGIVWSAGRKPTKSKWIGLKAHLRGLQSTAHLEMHSGPTGYLGIAPIEDGWSNICGLFEIDRSTSAKQQDLLAAYLRKNGNTRLATAIENAEWKPGSFTAVAGFELGLQPSTPGLLCLGDSHSIIPPFTGNGMSMAFQAAETALPHLLAYAHGKLPWETASDRITQQLAQRFSRRLTSAKFIHPLLFRRATKPFLKIAPIAPILNLVR